MRRAAALITLVAPACGCGVNHIWHVTFMHYDLGYFDDET